MRKTIMLVLLIFTPVIAGRCIQGCHRTYVEIYVPPGFEDSHEEDMNFANRRSKR